MTLIRSGSGKTDALASRLRERVQIESVSETADGLGGVSCVWHTHALCFAEVKPLSVDGDERLDAAQLVMQVSYRITVRTRQDINSSMRVVWRGKVMNIRAVIPYDTMTEIVAEEGVAL